MKIPAIKKLVETYSLEEIQAAEEALMEGEALPIEVEGEDEGEQLTHILAGIWVHQEMQKNETPLMKAIRDYAQKVRNSIS